VVSGFALAFSALTSGFGAVLVLALLSALAVPEVLRLALGLLDVRFLSAGFSVLASGFVVGGTTEFGAAAVGADVGAGVEACTGAEIGAVGALST